jgi:hypothetical protein
MKIGLFSTTTSFRAQCCSCFSLHPLLSLAQAQTTSILLIRGYQVLIPRHLKRAYIYTPTCSYYAFWAAQWHRKIFTANQTLQ